MRKITFQERSETRDLAGVPRQSFTDIYSTGGEVRAVTYQQTNNQDVQIQTAAFAVEVPYSQKALDLTNEDFVLTGGVRYEIIGVDAYSRMYDLVTVTVRRLS